MKFYVPSPWANDARLLPLEEMIGEDVLGHDKKPLDEALRQLKKVDHAQK